MLEDRRDPSPGVLPIGRAYYVRGLLQELGAMIYRLHQIRS